MADNVFERVSKELLENINMEKALFHEHFFRCFKGGYGAGDKFLGINVPIQRKISRKYFKEISFNELQKLVENEFHEFRLTGFFILVLKYDKTYDEAEKERIVEFYIKNIIYVNNWDIVDTSADKILGRYLLNKKDRSLLYQYANSNNLWKKRVAILSTFEFIRNYQFEDTLKISEILLNDNHDLIHKAVGWMLREVGKRDQKTEEFFLNKYAHLMPRTMLRYSIEKFDKEKKEFYLKKKWS